MSVYQESKTVRIAVINSSKDKNGKLREKQRFDVDIYDWKKAGLDHESRVQCDYVFEIDFSGLIKYYGDVSKNFFTYIDAKSIVALRKSFESPKSFLAWLKRNEITNTATENGISDLNIKTKEDLMRTKTANSIDISVINHYLCNESKFVPHSKIGYIRFFNSNFSYTYLLSMFSDKYNNIQSLYWADDLKYTKICNRFKSYNDALINTAKSLRKFQFKNTKIEYMILNDYLMKYIDEVYLTTYTTTQKEFVKYIKIHSNDNIKTLNEEVICDFFSNIKFK